MARCMSSDTIDYCHHKRGTELQEEEDSREALEDAILLWRSKYRILDQGNRWEHLFKKENWKYGWEEEKTATQYKPKLSIHYNKEKKNDTTED
ncbi:hypothetical protein EOD39_1767 [Acipenser ruthenus]|uniref:Uncharacterized protein n=1 Tax=Acipenser ruthenus TaxID=7906 RepID=A0A444U843_ACIRT|nr:hypothetical protein EOD39_1767 [Acipenser ruthenus]